jgi:hypothetical protein
MWLLYPSFATMIEVKKIIESGDFMRKHLQFEIALIASLILVLTVACSVTEAKASPKIHRDTLYEAKLSQMSTPEFQYIRYPQVGHLSNTKAEMIINKTLMSYAEKVYADRKKFIKENPPFKGGGEIMKSQYGLSYKVRYLNMEN